MKTDWTIEKSEALWVNDCPVDLKIKLVEGEINFLCGPNGAGKTSVLTFFKGNRELFADKKIAFIDQGRISPLGNLSVEESLLIIREECGTDQKTFSPNLIEGLGSKKVKELSGGENQLLKYVLGTASYFDLLFVDEPLLNLDAENKRHFISLFKKLTDLGKTLLVVEHEPARYGEVKGMTNQILDAGDRKEVVSGRI